MSRQSTVVSIKTSYKDLKVWQKSIELAKLIYGITEDFPKREHYGLASQMRRAGVSIASNIAEGAARHSNKEFIQFLIVARGSLAELATQTIIAHEAGFIDAPAQESIETISTEISKMLSGLRSRLTTND